MTRLLARPICFLLKQPHISSSRNYATSVQLKPREDIDPQLGDYPQLPSITNQLRPPKGWWDNQMRRDYGETLHEEDDALNMWSPDPPTIEPSSAVRQFALAFLGISGIGFWAYNSVPDRPAVPREYPYNGLIEELGKLEENKANPERESSHEN